MKKLLAIVLVGIMALGVLAGCGGKEVANVDYSQSVDGANVVYTRVFKVYIKELVIITERFVGYLYVVVKFFLCGITVGGDERNGVEILVGNGFGFSGVLL